MEEHRYFEAHQMNDAITRAALKIGEYETNPNVTIAYVTLSRLPDGISTTGRSMVSWTKTNHITSTSEGYPT